MQSTEQITSEQSTNKLPETYYELIEKVGDIGPYQYKVAVIVALTWYGAGVILLSTAFIFLNPKFDCEAFGLLTEDCYSYVCSLPRQLWGTFVTSQSGSFKSLANAFDQYYCDDQVYLNLYASTSYLGAFFGYIFVSFFADNYGRRKTLILSWFACCLGCLVLVLSRSLWMAGIGLFLCGFGTDSGSSLTLSIISEQFNDVSRQKISTLVQGTFTFGSLFITLIYYIWKDWFIAITYFLFIPMVLTLISIIIVLKESPLYLLRERPSFVLKELNQIALMNIKEPQVLTLKDIQNVIEHQQSNQFQQFTTPLDVFRYRSLRLITIAQGIACMCTYLVYYGPVLIVDQFGFDIYTSNTILNLADLLTYYPLMVLIPKLPRRKACMVQFGTASVIAGIMIFLTKPQGCVNCATIYIQLGLIFIFRFMVSMAFVLMLIYQNQLFPIRVRNIATGVLGIFGTVCSTTSYLIMGVFTRAQLNHFILFTALALIATACFSFTPETLGKLCPEQIEEIEYLKMKRSQSRKEASMLKNDKLHEN